MKILNKSMLLLLAGSLLFSTSCGGNQSNPEDSSEINADTESLDAYDIYVSIQNVEISLDDLKERDYTVPVFVTLDKNAGISYTEWGLYFDSRCQVEAATAGQGIDFNIVASVNDEEHFIWTAWASTSDSDYPGTLMRLDVTIPEDAALGDTYPITYAATSLADKPHVWNSTEKNWVTSGSVGWKDGSITIGETSNLTVPNFYADELD